MREVPPGERLLTPAEAAAALGASTYDLRRLERLGRITPARTPGGTRRYPEASVRALRGELDAAAAAAGELVTARQVAAMFGVSLKTVSRWTAQEKIPSGLSPLGRREYPAAGIRALLPASGEGVPG